MIAQTPTPAPLRVFEVDGGGGGDEAAALVIVRVGDATGGGRVLACRRCGHRLTTAAARVSVDGRHEHMRPNPHGYVHRFGCFAEAPGCASQGVPSR